MTFTIKAPQRSKCESCALAHHLETTRNTEVTICQRIGMAVKDVKVCTQFLSVVHAPIPAHIAALAWLVDPGVKRSPNKMGFGTPPTKTVLVADSISQDIIGPLEDDDDADEDVSV